MSAKQWRLKYVWIIVSRGIPRVFVTRTAADEQMERLKSLDAEARLWRQSFTEDKPTEEVNP